MNHTAKLWAKYIFGAFLTGIGFAMAATTAYDMGSDDAVEPVCKYVAEKMSKDIYNTYGDEEGKELVHKINEAIIKNK